MIIRKIINVVLILLSSISLIIVLKLSSLPVLCFPDFFVTTPEIRDAYSLVYDVCLGLLLSILFYFIVDVIPDCIRIKKSKKIINSYIEQILQHMNLIISISLKIYKRDNISLKDIALKDLKFLNNTNTYSNKEFSYSLELFNLKNERITGFHEFGTLDKIIKSSIKNIQKNIEYNKKYEYLYATNEVMLELLRKIESCGFIKCYAEKKENDTNCYILSHTDKEMYEFISLYKSLVKQKYHNKYSVITLDNDDETAKYRHQRNNGDFIAYSISCNKKRNERYSYFNPILITPNSYNSSLVRDKFIRNFPVETYNINDIDNFKPLVNKSTKLLIIIVSRDTVKVLKKLLCQIDFPIKLFIISECTLLKSHYPLEINSEMISIQKRYSYLSSKYIFNKRVLLHKEHPTDNEINDIIKDIDDYMLDGIEYDNI